MVDLVKLGADLESVATQVLLEAQRIGGNLRPTTIQPYRGFVTEGIANVRGRVVVPPLFEAAVEGAVEGASINATLRANLLRWVVLDVPDVEVTVSIGDSVVTAVSDDEGFVTAKVPVGDIAPGWHAVNFSAEVRGQSVEAAGRVVRPDPSSQIAVITDIDDTILRTGITEGLTAARRTLFRNAYGRKPITGTPSLYRGLARGTGGRPESTFFYVSSSPWNLYDMLVQFLQLRGFPRGPLFLTDWRPAPQDPDGGKDKPGHKRARIRRLLDAYPELKFVLIGDSGEHDPEIYDEFIDSDADRIEAALVRDVRPRSRQSYLQRESSLARRLEGLQETVLCHDALHMAEMAQILGLTDELTIEEVHTELTGRF